MASGENQSTSNQQQSTQRQQGVLWKRRDVFKNKWRPRWFVLQPEEAVITYYLLSKTDSTAATTISTPLRRSNNQNNNNNNVPATDPPAINQPANPSVHSTVSDLTTENTATVSENPVDYDVVPRGAIYLAGCTVTVNDKLSLPQEGLFAFSIVPPNSAETECHLAARTEEARTAWVATLTAACNNNAVGENGNTTADNQNDQGTSSSESSWKSLSPLDKLFEKVPDPLAAKLEQCLESHLELCEEVALNWTPIFQNRAGVSASQRQDLHGRVMMKSTAVVDHHPKQILSLLVDPTRRQDYESNIAQSERLEVLSHHTFLDYYAFRSVWPTSPRDFAVVLHWQALRRQLADGKTEEALALIAFSCPEAESLKEPSSPYVRASLHASFYLLRLIPPSDQADAKCHIIRILSYDLGGNLPRNLATTVLMQQAGMPGILSQHLKRVEPEPEARLSTHDGLLDNEAVIADVVANIIQQGQLAMVSSARRRLNFDTSDREGDSADATKPNDPQQLEATTELSLPKMALILLLPLILYGVTVATSWQSVAEAFDLWFLHPSSIFMIASFVACRMVALSSLGTELPNATLVQSYQGGPITCTVNVDLKGVLRFIGMKKEEQRDLATSKSNQAAKATRSEVSLVHIVAIALARTMQNHADCWNYRRVRLPCLFLDSFFRYPSSKLDVSLSLPSGRLVCLEDFEHSNVQAVANAITMLASEEEQTTEDMLTVEGIMSKYCSLLDVGRRHGRCLIILTKTDAEDDHQASNSCDVGGIETTVGDLPDDIDVLVVVGGVRLQRGSASVGSPLRTSPPKPILSLSLTINTSSLLDTSKCHAFAEDLAKLIQFPELCEE